MFVRRRTYKNYAGCLIPGTADVPLPQTNLHLERAYYLTAMIEAPKYGAVQSYDGAGMSGGPLHNIAVYPANKRQGSMFPLLRAIEYGTRGSAAVETLWRAYAKKSWYVARDGQLRHIRSGVAITGSEIIETFTPPGGTVPPSGPAWDQAVYWATLHHHVFSDPKTFHAQREFAIDYLIYTQKIKESVFYGEMNPLTLRVSDIADSNTLSYAEDLAVCLYHSNSVNAPAPAISVLTTVLKYHKRGHAFAGRLIQGLAEHRYGNWDQRYLRTRTAAIKSDLWPAELFRGPKAIMPQSWGEDGVA